APDELVLGEIDDAHAACSDLAHDPVAAKNFTDHGTFPRWCTFNDGVSVSCTAEIQAMARWIAFLRARTRRATASAGSSGCATMGGTTGGRATRPSAHAATRRASSGVAMPKPTATGARTAARTSAMRPGSSSRPLIAAPVTPVIET